MKQLEAVVANINDLKDGEMQQVSVGETEVLLSRLNGKFYAVGAHCSHYKAPLAEGVLSGHHVVCPWHNACFDVTSGDQTEPPGLDSLACYGVRIEGENVIVSVPEKTTGLRSPSMAQFNPNVDKRTFVILGAGAAGSHAAEALRVAGYQGRIVMITQEDKLPYDRTKLIDTPQPKGMRILASSVLSRYLNASIQISPFGYVHFSQGLPDRV